jgi:cytochrome c-type biogenesis protein CcmF
VRRDLFVALGEPLGGDAWAVRVHIKPFIRWVWLGAILMALGGFVTAVDRRFRKPRSAADDHESTLSELGAREQKRNRQDDPGIGDATPANDGGAD